MGYENKTLSVEVHVRLSRHNSERDERHNALASEFRTLLRAFTRSLLSSGKYDEILTDGPIRIPTASAAIQDDVTLTLNSSAGVLFHMPLRMSAIVAEVNSGEILPFVYDRHVPDEDEEHVPALRRARLMIVDDGVVPTVIHP